MKTHKASIEEILKDPVGFKRTVLTNVFIETFGKDMPMNITTMNRMSTELSDDMMTYMQIADGILNRDPELTIPDMQLFIIAHNVLIQKSMKHLESNG